MNKLILCGLLVQATTVLAQKEQWLEYHTSSEGRGYRWLELSTNPPPNLAVPKCNARPYFARFSTPLDPGGRWLCLDRTRKAGPYDRVLFDSTGSGRLEEKSALKANQVNEYEATFEPARFVFKGEDGPITYHLVFRSMKFESREPELLIASGGYYAGQVDFGGKKRRLEVVDGNVNGIFNDLCADGADGDRVVLDKDKVGERYLGRMVEAEGQFYRIEVARDGAFVKVQKVDNLTFGTVRVPEGLSEIQVLGENGHFVRKPAKGEFSLPVGRYHIHEWSIHRKDDKGATWQLTGSGLDASARFEVGGAPIPLAVGEPIRAVMQPSETPNQTGFSLRFVGQYNETIQITKNSQRPTGPRLTLTSLDGTYRYTNTFEFG